MRRWRRRRRAEEERRRRGGGEEGRRGGEEKRRRGGGEEGRRGGEEDGEYQGAPPLLTTLRSKNRYRQARMALLVEVARIVAGSCGGGGAW